MSDSDSCDFTRPVEIPDAVQPGALPNAQYSIYSVVAFKHEKIIGTGFDLASARALVSQLNNRLRNTRDGIRFGSPGFGLTLRMPAFLKNESVREGDVLLAETHLAARVVEAQNGKPVRVRDRNGERPWTTRKAYFVFQQDQFDIATAWAELDRRDELFRQEGFCGVPWGYYGSAEALGHVLRQFLIPEPVKQPSEVDIVRILEINDSPTSGFDLD